jgi:hypothetical protein
VAHSVDAWREKLQSNLFSIVLIGHRTAVSSWLGLVSGTWGIFYGLKAKQFTAYGRFSSREPENFTPNWRYCLFVISISTIAVADFLKILDMELMSRGIHLSGFGVNQYLSRELCMSDYQS